MIRSEFVEATSRLETYYEKDYTDEQRKIMFDELKNLSIERYRKVISQCIRSCKFLPKVADLIKANGDIIETGENKEITKYECDKCNQTGYVIYTKIIQDGGRAIPYTYALRCTCKNGENANQKVPTYAEMGIEIADRLTQVTNAIDINNLKRMLNKIRR